MSHQPFDTASQIVLRKAQELAKSGDGVVSTENVLAALLTDAPAVRQLLHGLDVTELTAAVSQSDTAGNNFHAQAMLANSVKRVLAYSMEEWFRARGTQIPPESRDPEARSVEAFFGASEFISPEFILLGVLREVDCDAAKLLNSRGLTVEKVRKRVAEQSI
jgi:ATP-dependent Clp protease ATP-binding subunit ClpA